MRWCRTTALILIVAELNRCWEVTQDQDKASKIEKAQFETKRDAKSETTFMLYTHSPVARTFFGTTRAHFVCAHFAHIFLRVRHTHGSRTRKDIMCAYVVSLLISPSLFSCFTRLSPLFLHGHFETNLTDALIHTFLPNFLHPTARVKRTQHEDEQFGYLAESVSNVMSPRSSTRILSWMMTRRPSTIRTTISLTSRSPQASTLDNSVLSQCLNHLFCTFLIGVIVPQRERKDSMLRESVARQRNKRKRRFCDRCCRVDVSEKSTGQY